MNLLKSKILTFFIRKKNIDQCLKQKKTYRNIKNNYYFSTEL